MKAVGMMRSKIKLFLLSAYMVLPGCRWSGPPTYLSFCGHGQAYYSNFATGCNQLIKDVNVKGTNEVQLKGDDKRLPQILRDMQFTYVNVSSNQAWVVVDIDAPYGVLWHPRYLTSNQWELQILSEAGPKDVYYKTNM
jgi:hypothetical protein